MVLKRSSAATSHFTGIGVIGMPPCGSNGRGASLVQMTKPSDVGSPEATPKTRQNLALALALAGRWQEARTLVGLDLAPVEADKRIVEWMVKKFKDANGVDLAADKIAAQRLQEAAEKAKIELSSSSETTIHLPAGSITPDFNP